MKPEIKLFFDFEFTSLSPDAQPISLGIISQEYEIDNIVSEPETTTHYFSKSFYAEFSDFDPNRCDDWVKENVVSKLQFGKAEYGSTDLIYDCISVIKEHIKNWLSQFSDYNITFVCDCGTFDWYWMLQLLDERHPIASLWLIPEDLVPNNMTNEEFAEEFKKGYNVILCKQSELEPKIISSHMIGLPKLPDNISPVPEDLNDLIAHKKCISIREAFDLNREDEVTVDLEYADILIGTCAKLNTTNPKHNALWDAKIIKAIYEKLKS